MKEAFEKVETQPDSVEKYGALDKGPATYGVVKKLRDNDMELHTNKQVKFCSVLLGFKNDTTAIIFGLLSRKHVIYCSDVFLWLTCSKDAQRQPRWWMHGSQIS